MPVILWTTRMSTLCYLSITMNYLRIVELLVLENQKKRPSLGQLESTAQGRNRKLEWEDFPKYDRLLTEELEHFYKYGHSRSVYLLWLHYGNMIENHCGSERQQWHKAGVTDKMTATQRGCLRGWPVRINSGRGQVADIQHAEWTWLGGRLANESGRQNGVKHHSKSRNLPLVSYRERQRRGKV